MKRQVCECCGANLREEKRNLICDYCGAVYKNENATPEATSIDADETLEPLLKRADLYWRLGKTAQAKKLYR